MSKLTELHGKIAGGGYTNESGDNIKESPEYIALLKLCEESYMHGLINGAKKFAVFRGGQKVLGPFEVSLADYIEEQEEKFDCKYQSHLQRQGV